MNTKRYAIVIGLTIATSFSHAGTSKSQNVPPAASESKQIVVPSDSYWSAVDRDTARYPIVAKQSKVTGCATVEYTLTPANKITNINVVSASNNYFAQAARSAVDRWNLEAIEGKVSDTDVITQTRFEFCNEDSAENCGTKPVSESYCKGDDVIAVVTNYRPINASSDISIDRARNNLRNETLRNKQDG